MGVGAQLVLHQLHHVRMDHHVVEDFPCSHLRGNSLSRVRFPIL